MFFIKSAKKCICFILVLLLISSIFIVVTNAETGKGTSNFGTIYFYPGEADIDDPEWFAYTWGTSDAREVKGKKAGNGYYSFDNIQTKVVLVRMPERSNSINWETAWNQSYDIELTQRYLSFDKWDYHFFTVKQNAWPKTSGEVGECNWSFDKDNGVLSVSGSGSMRNTDGYDEDNITPWEVLKDKIKGISIGKNVTSVRASAFSNCPEITSVIIPSSVDVIGSGAFENCKSLTNVYLSEGLHTISWGAFQNCTRLSYISFPRSLNTINGDAFSKCSALNNVFIPSGVKTLKSFVFERCTNLKNVVFENGVTDIGFATFLYSNISKLTLPNTIKSLHFMSFGDCKIKDVYYSGTKKQWNNLKQTYNPNENAYADGLKNATIHFSTLGNTSSSQSVNIDSLSDAELLKKYSDYLSDNGTLNYLTTCRNECFSVINCYKGFDIFKIGFFTNLKEGLGFNVITNETLSKTGFTRSMTEQAIDKCTQSFLQEYYNLQSTDSALASGSKKVWTLLKNLYSISSANEDKKKTEFFKILTKYTKYSKEELEKTMNVIDKSQAFADAGITTIEAVATLAIMAYFQKDDIAYMKFAVEKRYGRQSDIYNGLSEEWYQLDHLSSYVLRVLGKSLLVKQISKLWTKKLISSLGASNAIVTIAKAIGGTIALVYEVFGGEFADDYLEACESVTIASSFYYSIFEQTSSNDCKLMYDSCIAATKAALQKAMGLKKANTVYKTQGVMMTHKTRLNILLNGLNDFYYSSFIRQCREEIKNKKGLSVNSSGKISKSNSKGVRNASYSLKSTTSSEDVLFTENTLFIPSLLDDSNQYIKSTETDEYSFSGDSEIDGVVCPNSFEKFGKGSFESCSNLSFVFCGENTYDISEYAFQNCGKLSLIMFSERIENIGESAFEGCNSLSSVELSDSLNTLGRRAFCGCSSLTEVIFSNSTTEIGDEAFANCSDELTIYGYSGSTAEEYANENNISFVDLDKSVVSLEIASEANQKSFEYGSEISTEGLTLNVAYSDGTEEEISSGWDVNANSFCSGNQVVDINYGGKTVSYSVSITNIPEVNMHFAKDSIEVGFGEIIDLDLQIDNARVDSLDLFYESSDENVVSVDNDKAIAKNPGNATVTVTLIDNGIKKTASCNVTVTDTIAFKNADEEYSEQVEIHPSKSGIYRLTSDNNKSFKAEIYDEQCNMLRHCDNRMSKDVYLENEKTYYIAAWNTNKNLESLGLNIIYPQKQTIYFVNSSNWTTPYCSFKNSSESNIMSSVNKMEKTFSQFEGFDVYKYSYNSEKYDRVIFGDGENNLEDSSIENGKCYYPNSNNWMDIPEKPSIDKLVNINFLPDEKDDNVLRFELNPNDDYNTNNLLGVQKKSDKTHSIRFITAVSSDILSDDSVIDYGYVFALTDDDTATARQNAGNLTINNGYKISCKDTVNNFTSGYGNIDWGSTKYKYITAAIKNINSDSGIVSRFYVETKEKTYYAIYTRSKGENYNGCVVRWSEIE